MRRFDREINAASAATSNIYEVVAKHATAQKNRHELAYSPLVSKGDREGE